MNEGEVEGADEGASEVVDGEDRVASRMQHRRVTHHQIASRTQARSQIPTSNVIAVTVLST